ncbi:transposase [Salinimicrobium sp. WS361]|uniref:transposase n=1 Tax=Salinimicrobium sp. WS361 TaxID=3425123 RepID=UPI003D6E89CF
MSAKSGNKFRNGSIRLQHWDYGWDAAYFITICTKDRKHFFGEVQDGEIKLSSAGVIANVLWYEILHHAKNVELGEFVVMPNHIHGIIILNGNKPPWTMEGNDRIVGSRHVLSPQSIPQQSTDGLIDEPNTPEPEMTPGQKLFQNQGKNTVSSIVGSYKSAVTKHANRLKLEFGWQSLFYDHIIRDHQSFERISNYIKYNPANWKDDSMFPEQ